MMNVFFCLSCFLVIKTPFQSCPTKCNELNVSGKGNMLYDYLFTPEVKAPKDDGGKEQDTLAGNKQMSYKTSEVQIKHHEEVHTGGMENGDHRKELKEHMDQLKMLHKSLKSKDRNTYGQVKPSGGESVHSNDGALGDTHTGGDQTSEESLAKYVQNEIKNNEKLNKEKKSYDEINLLEDNSKKLQNDSHTWLQSVKNITEKTSKLKDIKTQLLNNIASLNETLTEEIENINEIKKLQKEQNEIFSENWLYFLPSTSDSLASEGRDGSFQVLNYLEKFSRRDAPQVSSEPASGELQNGGLPNGGLPNGGLPNGGLPNGGFPNGGFPNGGPPNDGNVRKAHSHTDDGAKSSDSRSFCSVLVLLAIAFLLS
uniref:Rhoptry neck protein n=1 Tax=Plasmodium vivax TaxID=5855 RepID=A0A5A4MJK1_PLAVI|nr:rhoptry neck protein [Plasmodium vivax]